MKKIAILIAALSVLFCSCDLDTFPEDKQTNDTALQTMSDLKKFERGTYSAFRANFNTKLIVAADLQADYANAVNGFGNVLGPLHKWEFTYQDYDVRDVWKACYFTIAQINFVLSKDGSITYDPATQQAEYNMIMGEMYFMRAMSYFQLIDKFCGDYNTATASKDYSGVPVLAGFDPQGLPSRSTLDASYTQVLEDLKRAATLLKDISGLQNATGVTIDCVTALQARVYLQMHNNDEAYKKAKSLIDAGTYPLVNTASDLKDIFVSDKGSEVIFVFYASKTELPAIYGDQFVYDENSKDDYYKPQYIPTQTLVDMYSDADIRKNAFFIKAENKTCEIGGNKISTPVYLMNKYPGNPALQTTAGKKSYRNAFKAFRIAEMYLIAAEAGLTASGGDAKTPLNDLRKKRGLAELSSVTLADVKAERMREMMFEGNRISDLKRWGDGISARKPQVGKNAAGDDYALITSGDSYEKLNIAKTDYRFVWPIPGEEIYANQNLANQQNPGWSK